jgi:hypothetical protein
VAAIRGERMKAWFRDASPPFSGPDLSQRDCLLLRDRNQLFGVWWLTAPTVSRRSRSPGDCHPTMPMSCADEVSTAMGSCRHLSRGCTSRSARWMPGPDTASVLATCGDPGRKHGALESMGQRVRVRSLSSRPARSWPLRAEALANRKHKFERPVAIRRTAAFRGVGGAQRVEPTVVPAANLRWNRSCARADSLARATPER